MSNPIDLSTASQVATLITFSHGEGPTVHRYARWTDDVVSNGETFTAVPTMEANLGEQHGGVKDEPAVIRLPATLEPVVRTIGQRYGPIHVTIEEVIPGDDSSRRKLFYGRLSSTTKNPKGRSNVAEIKIAGWKNQLDAPLGLKVLSTCINVLGKSPCGVNLAPHKQTGTIDAITDSTITISGLTTRPDFWWHSGSVTVDGYEISIKYWKSGDTFVLVRPPPADWLDASCVVTPGCDGTLRTCRGTWNREEDFLGLGIAIIDRDPMFEEGEG